MEKIIDKRRSERLACESPIVCSSLNGKSLYPARTINHCETGIGFITRTRLETGMTIFFRTDTRTRNRMNLRLCRTMRGTGLAEIRWCRRLKDREPVSYCVGAEYVEPYP
jgi:hypothetical protein